MDIDLLDQGTGRRAVDVVELMKRVCEQDVTPDGLAFDPGSAEGTAILEEAATIGVRVRLKGTLGTERVVIQVDVAFGDAVVPAPSLIIYPTLLDFPAPEILGYSRESVVSEKFDAMVTRGALNTRLKDFYDIWLLSRDFEFDGRTLSDAIRRTSEKRGTHIPPLPVGLTRAFADSIHPEEASGRRAEVPHRSDRCGCRLPRPIGPSDDHRMPDSQSLATWRALVRRSYVT
jgi:hypothetical protein